MGRKVWDRVTIKHGLYAENFRRPFPSLFPLFRDICDQEMAGARCRFPRRVKRLTVKLIESFKVIGIDNGEVNKSHHHPASSPTPPLKGCSVEGRGGVEGTSVPSRKSRERERETTRGGTNVLCPVIFLPLLFTTTDIVYSGETEKGSIRSTLISRHHPIGLIGVEPTNFIRRRRIVTFLIRVCGACALLEGLLLMVVLNSRILCIEKYIE